MRATSAAVEAQKESKTDAAIGALGALTGILGDIEIERVKNANDATKLDGRHTNTMWGEVIYNAKKRKWPWQTDKGKSVLAKIEDYQARTALKIQQEGVSLKNEISARWKSSTSTWKMWNDAGRPMPELSSANVLREMGRGGDALGVIGGVAEVLGIKAGDQIGDAGTVVTGIADIGFFANIKTEFGQILKTPVVQKATNAVVASGDDIARAGKGLTALGKVSGVLSMVTGAYSAYTGYQDYQAEKQQHGGTTRSAKVAALDGLSGVAAIVGGATLLFVPPPVGVAISAVAFATSGVLSLVSLGIEHGSAIKDAVASLGRLVANSVLNHNNLPPVPTPGTQYSPPASTSTPPHTPPAPSTSGTPSPTTPTPTPQVTQTPTPPDGQ